MKKILLFPVYILSIFSEAKSFKANPVIGSRVLNILGLHIARILLARFIYKLRQLPLTFLVSAQDRSDFSRNGFIQKNNFLPEDMLGSILTEVNSYNGAARQCIQGDTVTWRVFLDKETLARLPALKELVGYKPYLNLLKYTAAKNEAPLFYIQQIRNNYSGMAKPDPQKNLHSDTFHPTMKAWLFLEDVPQEKGPFTIVPESAALSWKRLKWEYKKSISGKNLNDGYSEKGSMRLTDEERTALGYPEPHPFAVKKNTLVVANTNGFHCRGAVTLEKATRLEIWAYSRPNPFNPWPGLGIRYFSDLRDKLFNKYLSHNDRKAESAGRRPSWHKVEGAVI